MKVEFMTDGPNSIKEGKSSVALIYNDKNKIVGFLCVSYKKEQVAVIKQFEIFDEDKEKNYEEAALKELVKILKEDHYRYIICRLEMLDSKMNRIFGNLGFETVGGKFYLTTSKYLIRIFDIEKKDNNIEKLMVAANIYPEMFKAQ